MPPLHVTWLRRLPMQMTHCCILLSGRRSYMSAFYTNSCQAQLSA